MLWSSSSTTLPDLTGIHRETSTGAGRRLRRLRNSCSLLPSVSSNLLVTIAGSYSAIIEKSEFVYSDGYERRVRNEQRTQINSAVQRLFILGMKLSSEILDSARLEGGHHIDSLTPNRLSSSKFTVTNAL